MYVIYIHENVVKTYVLYIISLQQLTQLSNHPGATILDLLGISVKTAFHETLNN